MIELQQWLTNQGAWQTVRLVSVDQLSVVGDLAGVAWDRDIADKHDLPLSPPPRLYLAGCHGGSQASLPSYLVFGGLGGQWSAVAVWRIDRWHVFVRSASREHLLEFVRDEVERVTSAMQVLESLADGVSARTDSRDT